MKAELSRQALIQLGGILEYIRERNPQTAARLARRFEQVRAEIAEHPELGRRQHVPSIRRKTVQPGGYLVYYSVSEVDKSARIVGISHPAQQEALQRRLTALRHRGQPTIRP